MENGKRYIRIRPDDFEEINLNFAIDSNDESIKECSIPNCKLCKEGVCWICEDEYTNQSTSCEECVYPKMMMRGICVNSEYSTTVDY